MMAGNASLAQTQASPSKPDLQTSATTTGETQPERILIVGDSLSSEYGIRRQSGWVELLRLRLTEKSAQPAQVINASISGDTTSGGVSRLPALLEQHRPTIVIIELGGNDALRGLSMAMTRDNLTKMVELTQKTGAKPILAGMQIPPNYGPAYAESFKNVFPQVADQTQAALIPFLLAGLETDRSLFIEDGIHPSEQAQPKILENVWEVLEPIIRG